MSQIYSFNSNPRGVARVKNLLNVIERGHLRPSDITGTESLSSVFGAENFSLADNSEDLSYTQKHASISAIKSVLSNENFTSRLTREHSLIKQSSGFESFSAALTEGAVARQKVASIELNVAANRQFTAAEAMYPTVFIGYDETMLELPIDVAGVGQYNVGGNVYEQFEDLRPLPSILSDSTFSSGDDLKLVPVFVDDENDSSYDRFVSQDLWEAYTETYDQNDLLGREPHLTNFLAPVKLNNLMNLCRAPGTPKWENNDEIEASSIRITRLLFKIKTKDGEGVYTLDTSAYPSNAMRTANHLNSKSARQLILKSEGTPVTAFKDKDGKDASELFKSLGTLKAYLQWDIRLEYHRDTRTLTPTITPDVTIHHVVGEDGNRLIVGSTKVPEDTAALIKAQAVEASIAGYELAMNHNNVNWSRYGQTIVYANTLKQYNVRRRQPISVKYPMSNDDTNTEVLAKCIRDMGLVISRNMTHDAFKFAIRHFDYLVENNGKKVVPINDDSNDVLPGQHFFTTTAADETINLKKATSTLDSKDVLSNVQAVLVNKITDVITDIRVRSGFSAVKEIDGRKEEYVIVAHASLAPYLMSTGDVRTFGQNVNFSVLETNVDSEMGRFWIFPKSETRDGNIDAFGGMGVCVAKELLVIEGDVRMDERQYRMQICQPAYEHHSTGCIAARIFIEDIKELMEDGGVLSSINRHLESTIIESLPDSAGGNGNGGGTGTGGDTGGGTGSGGQSDEVDVQPGE